MPDTETTAPNNPATIVGIECDGLFGHYSYDLRFASGDDQVLAPQMLLLYGDNGSGKTTIAQLLFHILSFGEKRGHRTFLAKTKFRRFCVRFDNDSSLAARREGDELVGPYTLEVTDDQGNSKHVPVKTSEDGAVVKGDVDEDALKEILSFCSPSPLDVYFLSDNRVLQSDVFEDEPSDEWISQQGRIVTRRFGDTMERMMVSSSTRDLTVDPSVWRAETWLRRQAIEASSAGELTTSNIYADIIKRITEAAHETVEDGGGRLSQLLDSLVALEVRSKAFASLGLSQAVPIESLSEHIRSATPAQGELVTSVLEPYVDSVRSRLDAFEDLQKRLTSFLNIINTFYRRKSLRITTSDGFQVFDDHGDQLDVSLLSSGEKQLLLLLCNILVATSNPSLFIIDEPELSLNVKWQRQIVDSLLSLVEGSHVQFIMATHSIELLTLHKDFVLKLDDISDSVQGN